MQTSPTAVIIIIHSTAAAATVSASRGVPSPVTRTGHQSSGRRQRTVSVIDSTS